MADVKSLFIAVKRQGKNYLFFIAIVLVVLWGIETPAGILGKADAVGYAVCHRIDVRSFHIGLRQLPLCARCTGQYIGAMLGLLFQVIFSRHRSGFPPKRVYLILCILGLAYAVDGLNSYLSLPPFVEAFPNMPHLYASSNILRLLTGSGLGLALSVILYPALIGTIYAHLDHRPVIGGLKYMLTMIGLCLIVDILILSGSPFILYSAALISSLGVIILLSFAYTIVILRIFKKQNTSERFSQIHLSLLGGFMLTMVQIALIDMIRYIMTGTWSGFIFG
jgi:uncharacterized membrane protein